MSKSEKVFEPVLMVWDIYDGPRTGLASFRGEPHYFECKFDESLQDFPSYFSLYLVENTFLKLAIEQWEIFRAWEYEYHNGREILKNHPGHRGVNTTYDKLDDVLENAISKLQKTPGKYLVEFRAMPDQDDIPIGILRELEASWVLQTD